MQVMRSEKEFSALKPDLKINRAAWRLIEFRLIESAAFDISISEAIEMMLNIFDDKIGSIYPCNERELLILVKLAANISYDKVAGRIASHFQEGTFTMQIQDVGPHFGLDKITLKMITPPASNDN